MMNAITFQMDVSMWQVTSHACNLPVGHQIATQPDAIRPARSKLVSTEAALDFLAELRGLNCGTTLEQKMMSKSADLIRQFGKEVDATSIAFHERKVSHVYGLDTTAASCVKAIYEQGDLPRIASATGQYRQGPYSPYSTFCYTSACMA